VNTGLLLSQLQQKELQKNKCLSRYMLVFNKEDYVLISSVICGKNEYLLLLTEKKTTDKLDESEFTQHTGTLPFGTQKTIVLAEPGVFLQNKGSNK